MSNFVFLLHLLIFINLFSVLVNACHFQRGTETKMYHIKLIHQNHKSKV